jgi:glutamate racemase
MIESSEIDKSTIAGVIDDACARGADVIVLGCTHYHWIEEDIRDLADGRARVIQPEPAVIEHVTKHFLGRAVGG